MMARSRKWRWPLCLCGVGLGLTLLYLCAYNALGQIPLPSGGIGKPTAPSSGRGKPTVQFIAGHYTVMQGRTATITVTLSAPCQQDVSVAYATSDGTGQSGVHYTPASGKLTFPAGTTSRSFSVSTLTHANGQSIAFNANLSSPSNATLGSASMATLNGLPQPTQCVCQSVPPAPPPP